MSELKNTRGWVIALQERNLDDSPDELNYLGQETRNLVDDWLAMYDLLKEIADNRPTCDGEISQLVKRIRALIGGE